MHPPSQVFVPQLVTVGIVLHPQLSMIVEAVRQRLYVVAHPSVQHAGPDVLVTVRQELGCVTTTVLSVVELVLELVFVLVVDVGGRGSVIVMIVGLVVVDVIFELQEGSIVVYAVPHPPLQVIGQPVYEVLVGTTVGQPQGTVTRESRMHWGVKHAWVRGRQ